MPVATKAAGAVKGTEKAEIAVPVLHDFGGKKVGPFKTAVVEGEWEGYKIVRVYTPEDMAILSRNGGGCCASHYFWTAYADPPSEYFLVMVSPKGTVGTILFCKDAEWWGKKHPQETLYQQLSKRDLIKSAGDYDYYHGTMHSDYYDYHWPPNTLRGYGYGYEEGPARYERALERARENYEIAKAEAIEKHGPLCKDHPMKADLDRLNKKVTACKGQLEKMKLRNLVQSGMTFEYAGRTLFIVEVAGRGLDYMEGANTRYTLKIAEWLKERGAEIATP